MILNFTYNPAKDVCLKFWQKIEYKDVTWRKPKKPIGVCRILRAAAQYIEKKG